MYAVLETGGKQYRVTAGDTLEIERLTRDEPRLTKIVDAQLDDVTDFCMKLLDVAATAEVWRLESQPR